jgi:hypothetical protein
MTCKECGFVGNPRQYADHDCDPKPVPKIKPGLQFFDRDDEMNKYEVDRLEESGVLCYRVHDNLGFFWTMEDMVEQFKHDRLFCEEKYFKDKENRLIRTVKEKMNIIEFNKALKEL